MENLEARQSRGTACLPRRAGEWFSRGLRLACSHGVRRVSTASVGRQFPGLGQGRPLRPISGAKRRHDLSSEEPHLLQQQIRGFILEQADVTKGQGEMLEAAFSKVFDGVNHLVGVSRDHVVALAKGSDITLDRLRSDVRRTEAGEGDLSAPTHYADLLRSCS